MLTLYHQWSSVYSQKVRFALAEKGLAWESRHVDLFKFENWEPEYIKLNPRGVVSTLDGDGRVIVDSNVIVEYLEDAYAEVSLMPGDAEGRANMRLWMKKADDVAHPSVVQASYNLRHRPRLAQWWARIQECPAYIEAFSFASPDPDDPIKR